MPKIEDIAIIDDPPRLSNGKGSPVKGIKPKTVAMLIEIWRNKRIMNPESKNFSKFESVLFMSE